MLTKIPRNLDSEEQSYPSLLKLIILAPSILSFLASFILITIILVNRSKQNTLSMLVFGMALSDLLYTFMGIFFTFDRYFQKCPLFLSSTREYARLASCGFAIAFAFATSIATKKKRVDLNRNFMSKSFCYILTVPIFLVTLFNLFYPHEYLDVLCWYDIPEDKAWDHDLARRMLEVPIIISFGVTLLIYIGVIVLIQSKMSREGNTRLSVNIYELLLYPMGILACYVWLFFDDFDSSYNSIRIVNIFAQQLQGLINFLLYGMNYQTRSQLKDYLGRISGRMYEFFHLQEKEKEREFEMHTVHFNTEYTNQDRYHGLH